MATIKLTDTVSLGDLNLEKSQFEIPKRVIILSARINNKYNNINGESVQTDEISKITCQVQDAEKVKVLKEMGMSADDLKTIPLEILDNLDKTSKIANNDGLIEKTIELINPQVRLAWNMNRKGWGGIKLTTSDIKIIGE